MKIIECPRDAWQGVHKFIPTQQKVDYLNLLLKVGFDTIDFGSFVSARAMPQVADTPLLLDQLDVSSTPTKLLAIVANERGAAEACRFSQINYLGFPFSISETFQQRNANASISDSLERVKRIAELTSVAGKEMVIYISMGFGNPYGDEWASEVVVDWVEKLAQTGIQTFSLSDTVGVAKTADISALFEQLISAYPELEFGAHFHTKPDQWRTKIEAAYNAGCRRFDGAILGYGGCPMAQDDLVGNMPTERLMEFMRESGDRNGLDENAFDQAKGKFLELLS